MTGGMTMVLLPWLLIPALPALYALAIRPNLPRRDMSAFLHHDYAHRGLWNAQRPENSLSAFRAAVEGGFGIELDVHLTADGHLVVHHDATLQRICHTDGVIEQLSLAQLRTCRLDHTNEPIPTLDEVLELVDGRVPLIVELKVEGNATQLSAAVYERMQRYHGPWCMESFHPGVLLWFRRHAPEVIRGQLAFNHLGHKDRSLRIRLRDLFVASMLGNAFSRPDFIAYEAASERPISLAMPLLRLMRPWLVCWTIRSQADMDRLRSRYDMQIFDGFVPRR